MVLHKWAPITSQKFITIGFEPKAIKTLVAPGLDGLRIAIRGDVGGVTSRKPKNACKWETSRWSWYGLAEARKSSAQRLRLCCLVFNARGLFEVVVCHEEVRLATDASWERAGRFA
jgi:hypothetical protein